MRKFVIIGGAAVLGYEIAAAQNVQMSNTQSLVDYAAFVELSEEVGNYREQRLVSKDRFLELMRSDDAIILDTRSKSAFDMGHLEGAVHLNFSEFTDEKLAKIIGSKDRPILIYCNNNFAEGLAPFPLKRIELALNIPTFINLYGYGYRNIYELGDTLSVNDPNITIVRDLPGYVNPEPAD